jgi:hypothetical protein
MCDYSLHGINNRLAIDGEQLAVHRFRTGSIGMAAAADIQQEKAGPKRPWHWLFGRQQRIADCAVCIPPGAKLTLRDIPLRIQRELRVRATEDVVFTQLTAETNTYRDAVRFSNGSELLLQRLDPGQRVTVVTVSPETIDQPAVPSAEETSQSPHWV